MEPPIIVNEDGDLSFYKTVKDAECSIEGVDVEDGVYQGFDKNGTILNRNRSDPLSLRKRVGVRGNRNSIIQRAVVILEEPFQLLDFVTRSFYGITVDQSAGSLTPAPLPEGEGKKSRGGLNGYPQSHCQECQKEKSAMAVWDGDH
ncbi:MAG: hypothetical protein HQL76_08955 [Magnetococcales bacterium]|nr:hypothetical protein [Magnetococcales bacterium]